MLINFQNYTKLERAVGRGGAKFIRRLDYWIDKCGKVMDEGGSHKWVFNTFEQWADQLNCSTSTVYKWVSFLEKGGIVLSKKFHSKQFKHVKYYTLNYKELSAILGAKTEVKIDLVKGSKSVTYNSTNRIRNNPQIFISNNTYKDNNNLSSLSSLSCINSDDEKDRIFNIMREEWVKVFVLSDNFIDMPQDSETKEELAQLYSSTFGRNLNNWSDYLKRINGSKFLMGEKDFKPSLTWLLKPDTIRKVLRGGYSVGDRQLDNMNVDEILKSKKDSWLEKAWKALITTVKSRLNLGQEFEDLKEYDSQAFGNASNDLYRLADLCQNQCIRYIRSIKEMSKIQNHIFDCYIVAKHLGNGMSEIRGKLKAHLDDTLKNTHVGNLPKSTAQVVFLKGCLNNAPAEWEEAAKQALPGADLQKIEALDSVD